MTRSRVRRGFTRRPRTWRACWRGSRRDRPRLGRRLFSGAPHAWRARGARPMSRLPPASSHPRDKLGNSVTPAVFESNLEELRRIKKRLDQEPSPSPRRPRIASAAERTVPLFEANEMGERRNNAPPLLQPGPDVERCSAVDTWCTHLRLPGAAKALCGGFLGKIAHVSGRICASCRIEASKLRAAIR